MNEEQQQQQREERMREGEERLRAETLARVLKYLDRAMAAGDVELVELVEDESMARARALGRIKAELFCARSVLRRELGVDDD